MSFHDRKNPGILPRMSARWLDETERRAWRAFLAASSLLQEALDRQLQRDADMPHSYYEVMVRLSEAEDRTMRMSALADASLSSRSRLSHAITRLEQRGWVERHPCEDDRRGQLAVLTDAGCKALEEAAPGHVEAVRAAVFDRLSVEQVQALAEISEKVREGLLEAGDAIR